MPEMNPSMTAADVAMFLQRQFGAPVKGLRPLTGGNVAEVYQFSVNGRDYVVRFAAPEFAAFEQEAFIADRYASPLVPIPRIAAIGQTGDRSYAISEAAPGEHIDALLPAETAALSASLFDVLDAIHAADTSNTTGWGWIGRDGNGLSSSWGAHIGAIVDPSHDHPYYGTWASVFGATALELADIKPLAQALTDLLPVCPEQRTLLHGDFGFTNVLVADGRITAVLDWANALYGDPLYDLAWLDFWGAGVNYAQTGRSRSAARGEDLTGFADRLACYQAYVALDAMRFFAKRDDASGLDFVRNRVRALGLGRAA